MCCRRPAVGKQHATGMLLFDWFKSLIEANKNCRPKAAFLFFETLSPAGTCLQPLFDICSRSYGPRPDIEGFSHGLKKCPPDTFLPSLRSGRPFKSPIDDKNTHIPKGIWVFLAEMEGFEPPHALRRLADFESAPFSHLGTSPYNPVIITAGYQKIKGQPFFFANSSTRSICFIMDW